MNDTLEDNGVIGPAIEGPDERGWHKDETWQESVDGGRYGDECVGMSYIALYWRKLDDGTFKVVDEGYYVKPMQVWIDNEEKPPIDVTRFRVNRPWGDWVQIVDTHRPERKWQISITGATFGGVPGFQATDEQIVLSVMGDEHIFTGERTNADVGAPGTATERTVYMVLGQYMITICRDKDDPGGTVISDEIEYDREVSDRLYEDLAEAEAVCRAKALEDQRYTLL